MKYFCASVLLTLMVCSSAAQTLLPTQYKSTNEGRSNVNVFGSFGARERTLERREYRRKDGNQCSHDEGS